MGKIEAGLKMPVIRNDKRRSSSVSPEKEERRVRRMSPGGHKDSSLEHKGSDSKAHGSLRSPGRKTSMDRSEERKKRNKRKVCKLQLVVLE